jgi:predicted RNA binding protein YcfA (HicA-like mRNA interferase family)
MSDLPRVTSKHLIAALIKGGFVQSQQGESHLTLRHPVTNRITTVPEQPGGLFRGLVEEIVKAAGLTEEELRKLL